jgi:AcrR family transcriptional regulator
MSIDILCRMTSCVVYAGVMQDVLTQQETPDSGARKRLPGQPAAPRRERKKQQTRDALIHAALELFQAKGYEHTAVREITDAIDVSERTFFRYFASKEDLTLSFVHDSAEALTEALAARPREEEPLTALRQAFRDSLLRVTADGGLVSRRPAYLSVLSLIESTPTLLATHLRYFHDHGETLAGALAEREGVDPATDPRPRIVTTLFAGLVSLANRDWQAAGAGDAEAMLAAFDLYANQLGPGLFGHWNAGDR